MLVNRALLYLELGDWSNGLLDFIMAGKVCKGCSVSHAFYKYTVLVSVKLCHKSDQFFKFILHLCTDEVADFIHELY